MTWLFKPIASLRLTLALLVLSLILVFLGTMAQEPLGLYLAQDRFFQSAFVDLASMIAAIKKSLQMIHVYLEPSSAADVLSAPFIPVFPGGYLLGSLLVVNLIAAHLTRFRLSWKKSGIQIVHAGLILLLIGQLLAESMSRETSMRLTEGETKSYSESDRRNEIALIDTSNPGHDTVVAIPESLLRPGALLSHPSLPFSVRVLDYAENSDLDEVKAGSGSADKPAATQGLGTQYRFRARPRVTEMNLRDLPSAVIELVPPSGQALGTWLVSSMFFSRQNHRPVSQEVMVDGRRWEVSMRPRRTYQEFSLSLLDFRHDLYPGTDKPKNFSSEIRLQNPRTGEDRTVKIYMNNPLRYQGLTYYQASFDPKDDRVTILQVVRNPAWLTPYVACILVGAGLVVQFGIHLLGFLRKSATAGSPASGSGSSGTPGMKSAQARSA